MQELQIPSPNGHDSIFFDRKTGKDLVVAEREFAERITQPGVFATTKARGAEESRKITSLDEADEVTTFRMQIAGG